MVSASALASSHREAPSIANDPAADATDLYAWRNGATASSATVTLIANYYPIGVPFGGPNYYLFDDSVLYEIKIDNNGDSIPDVVYQFRFKTDPVKQSQLPSLLPGAPADSFLNMFAPVTHSKDDANLLRQQTYSVTRITSAGTNVIGSRLPVIPWPVGHVTTPSYESVIVADGLSKSVLGPIKAFAGPRADPFFVDLHRTFDFLDYKPSSCNATSGCTQGTGVVQARDDLSFNNLVAPGSPSGLYLDVMSIAIEVPVADLLPAGTTLTNSATGEGFACRGPGTYSCRTTLGIWTTASRQKATIRRSNGTTEGHGPWVQISRLGNPLINEVAVPLKFKDYFNGSQPANDAATFTAAGLLPSGKFELPYLLQAKGFIPKAPPAPRTDILLALATPSETLHLDVSVPPSASPNRLGALANPADPAGFPNGRRLIDDVTDIALKVFGGALYQALGAQQSGDTTDYATPSMILGDGVDSSGQTFLGTFPYEASPTLGNP